MAEAFDIDDDGVMTPIPVRQVFLRTPYNYDVDRVSRETGQVNDMPSLAQQQFRDEVDINTIVERFGLTGEMPEDFRAPQYGDFTDVVDFQTAQNAVIAAQEAFMSMPAGLRARFQNSPQALMEFLSDDRNREEAVSLGIVAAPAAAAPPAPASSGAPEPGGPVPT